MKKLSFITVLICLSIPAVAGIPYLITPTNNPGVVGQQLFTAGNGYTWWDWGTNAAGSNSTVVSKSTTIEITTNGFNFSPFLSAAVTNWVNAQDANGTNQSWLIGLNGTNQSWLIGLNATNNDTVVSNGVVTYAKGTIGLAATNNDTVVSNGVFTLLNDGTNNSYAYARGIGASATNQDLKTSNTLWLTITNYYLNPVSGITIATNRSGQNVVFDLTGTAGGSGTGIQTNGGSGTNNIFTAPILQGASGSTDSNILYVIGAGNTNWVFRTNGDLVDLGPGGIFGLLSSGAMTNAAGSPVAYRSDVLNATNQDLKTSNTLWLSITNVYVAAGSGTTVTTNQTGQSSVYTIAATGGTGIATNNGTGTNNAFTTAKFLSVPGVQLANFTDSLFTQSTNWTMDSAGGAKMQRVYGGRTNGFMSVINARDYGLVATGGDQTAAIQAAITAATNSGLLSVYLPACTNVYTVNGLIIPSGVRLFGDSPKGVVGTGQGTTLYANNQNKPMLVIAGQNVEIEHISLYDDVVQPASVGILITNESALLQDFSLHDCTIKGFQRGIFMHYTWGGDIRNNMILQCNYGIDASNQVNAMHFSHNYFANTNSVWLHGDSNYKNTFDGVNEFEAFPSASFTSSNGITMGGINQSTTFENNYFEKITNGIVVNASYGTVIQNNAFINCPGGTNIIITGAEGPVVTGNRATDQMPFINVDSTTYGMVYAFNDVRSGASVNLSPINAYQNDTTNIVLRSAGSYYGQIASGAVTNGSGSRVAYQSDVTGATNEVTRQVTAATNETTLRVNGANIDGAINGQVITGAVSFVQFDASCFMTNSSYNSNAIAYVNMGAGSGSLQGSDTASPLLLYPLSSRQGGTNRWFLQWYPPPNYNGAAVNMSVNVLCATNTSTTGGSTNITISVSGGALGNALGTPVTVTNLSPGGVSFISTNINVGPITIGGSPAANTPIRFQVEYWNVTAGKITNNAWVQGCRLWYTNSATQNGAITGW